MKKNDLARASTSAWKHIARIFFGIILVMLLLEISLRFEGVIPQWVQRSENLHALKPKGAYRILCLGASMTQGQYPPLLERILNKKNIGVRFSVIDKAQSAMNTLAILRETETYLNEYHPDLVIAMLGTNDERIRSTAGSSDGSMCHLRVFRLGELVLRKISSGVNHALFSFRGWMSAKIPPKQGLRRSPPGDGSTLATHKEYLLSGEKLWEQNKLSEAEAYLQKALQIEPGNDRIDIALGKLYSRKGEFSKAIRSFGQAAVKNPRNVEAYLRLAWLHKMRSDFDEAEFFLKKALQLEPRDGDIFLRFGSLYQEQGRWSEAEDFLKKAIAMAPGNHQARASLGNLYRLQGRPVQAENILKKALSEDPKNDVASTQLGWLYLEQGKTSQAEGFFEYTLKINLKSDLAYAGLGRLAQDHHRFPEAEKFFLTALSLNPKNVQAYVELARLYELENRIAEAENTLRRAFHDNPLSPLVRDALYLFYDRQGKPHLAQPYADGDPGARADSFSMVTRQGYRRLKEILDRRKIQLVCVQFPMRSVSPLRKVFRDNNVIIVDNEAAFRNAVQTGGYPKYFRDMFAGDFGHCTEEGNQLLAQNIADVILREVFKRT